MSSRLKIIAAMFAAVALLGATVQPSDKLIQILSDISHFDDASLIAISYWASYPNPEAPDTELTALDHVQVQALQLSSVERDALFTWLNHGGRQKLLALGVTAAQIGPCEKPIDQQPCQGFAAASVPTSTALSGYRSLALRLMPPDPASGLDLQGGFAVLSGSTTLVHCIAFRNTSAKTAAAITFTYQLLDAANGVLAAGSDILVGSFASNALFADPSPGDVGAWAGNDAAQKPPNCWLKTPGGPGVALVRGTTLVVEVASVTYEDGTHWSTPQRK